ncbi:site-specific DNA recombinase [Natronincola peptidivorans]|uniref:Site-specific DNA recombinase n=1 Tax=Natronincola peptidivorans TaxID=426128 RepID=A0A1I0GHY1_9FIRM|nr:site-specific DNA recombinase [Natronincola peptidivorans]
MELCKEYGKLHFNTHEFTVYDDEGFSGGNADRPQFKKMMKDAKAKKFDVLICYRLDRISRNISDFTKLVEILQKHDITFVSIKEQFDTSTPMGRAMMYIALVFAQLERETIAERIRDNMMQLARTGRWLGGNTPLGFKSEAIIYYDNHMNKKKMYQLTPIPQELETVKVIYERYSELDSLTQLESWCLENNMKSKKDKSFDKSAIKLILTNPVYAVADEVLYNYFYRLEMDIASNKESFDGKYGVLVYNKKQEKKGVSSKLKHYSEWVVAISKHKGVIPSLDWIRVQNQLKVNSKKAPRGVNSRIALLTPLLVCGSCGSKLKVTYKVKEGEVLHHYYKCTLKERSRGSLCTTKNLNGKQAEEIVFIELKKFSASSSKLYDELYKKRASLSNVVETQHNKRVLLENQINHHKQTISTLALKLAENKGTTADKYIMEEIEKIDLKITELKKELEELMDHSQSIHLETTNLQVVKSLLKKFPVLLDEAAFDEKKKILQMIIKSIIWNGEQLEINVHGSN